MRGHLQRCGQRHGRPTGVVAAKQQAPGKVTQNEGPGLAVGRCHSAALPPWFSFFFFLNSYIYFEPHRIRFFF